MLQFILLRCPKKVGSESVRSCMQLASWITLSKHTACTELMLVNQSHNTLYCAMLVI